MEIENQQRPVQTGMTPFASLVAGLKLKRPSGPSLSTPRTGHGESSRQLGAVALKLRSLSSSMEGWADSVLQSSSNGDTKTSTDVSAVDMDSPRDSSDESNADYSTRAEGSNGSVGTTPASTPQFTTRPQSMIIHSRRSLDPRESAEYKLHESTIKMLRDELESTKKALYASQEERNQLKSDLEHKEGLLHSVKQDLEATRRAQEKQKQETAKVKEELEAKVAELEAEKQKVGFGARLIRSGLVQTPRALVMMLVARRTAGQSSDVKPEADAVSLLRYQDLDKEISESQADTLLTHLEGSDVVQEILNSAEIIQCESCHQLKFCFDEENERRLSPLHEYPKFIARFQPENANVCFSCRLRSITINFEKHVWQVYGNDEFLARIKHVGDLARVLHSLQDPDIEKHVKM